MAEAGHQVFGPWRPAYAVEDLSLVVSNSAISVSSDTCLTQATLILVLHHLLKKII